MILPQSEAFATLHRRLAAIPPASSTIVSSKDDKKVVKSNQNTSNNSDIDFSRLLHHFEMMQENHKEQKHRHRLSMLVERDSITNQGFDAT